MRTPRKPGLRARGPQTTRAGHDRWLLSYADLMTLLLAFFTTMYAASTMDATKLGPMAVSLQNAFSGPGNSDTSAVVGSLIVPPVRVLPHASALEDLHFRLSQELADALAQKRLELVRDPRGLVVSLPDDATFATASPDATSEARALVARIGETLRSVPNAIRIEGHTDNVPISTVRYASNWELSTARASAVVAFLVQSVGIEAQRLSASGYGEFHPRAPNGTEAERARNRRVDIVILDLSDRRERTGSMEELDARP